MFVLKMAEHSIEPERGQMAEIWKDNVFMGAIYPTEKGIKVISKYIADNPEAAVEIDRNKLPPIPAILINLI